MLRELTASETSQYHGELLERITELRKLDREEENQKAEHKETMAQINKQRLFVNGRIDKLKNWLVQGRKEAEQKALPFTGNGTPEEKAETKAEAPNVVNIHVYQNGNTQAEPAPLQLPPAELGLPPAPEAIEAELLDEATFTMPDNLTPRDIALWHALHRKEDSAARWTALREKGAVSDVELSEAVSKEFSLRGGEEKAGVKFAYCGGDNPKFFFGSIDPKGKKPSLQGKSLLEAVRTLLDLPKPAKGGKK